MGRFVPNPRVAIAMLADAEFQARMEAVGVVALEEAKQRAPVGETGNLRDSLKVERLSNGGRRVSANVDYWGFVEYGTSEMSAQPYLRSTLTALGLRVTP